MRLIHRAWEGLSPAWVLWTEQAVRSTHPGIKVRTVELDPSLPGRTPARRSNIYRLRKIYDQGGLWLDCDLVPLANLVTLWDEPWMGYQHGKLRPGVMFFPEGGHPLLEEALERALARPDVVLADHIAACAPTIRPEPRVLPHNAKGRWVLGNNQEPLAVHMWFSSGGLG